MTAMKGNPHYAETRTLMVRAEHASGPELADALGRAAQVEAMLALAWEQRTANLITCSQKVYIRDSPEQIRERLGEGVGGTTPLPNPDQSTYNIVLRELEKYDIDFPSPVAVQICEALGREGRLSA